MINLMSGDCLGMMDELIKTGVSVDSIVTDPPYGMSFQSNRRKNKYEKIKNDSSLEWLDDFAKKAFDLCNDNTASYVFCSFHNIDIFKQCFEKYFKVKNILVWEKNNASMGDLKGDFAPKVEFVLLLHKGRALIRGKRDPNIFKFSRTKNNFHPTEKPVDMISYLITKFSDEGNTILDPFMGSGTTGVACIKTKRSFIGIEIDKDYFEIAKDRIDKEQQRLSLF